MPGVTQTFIRRMTLTGTAEVLFDRYPGDNKTVLADPGQKLYLNATREVCLPTLNLLSFLTAQNTESAPKLCLDKRIYRTVCSALLASVAITPSPLIPFLRDGQPIVFGEFDENDMDPISGMLVVRHVARLAKGIPNPKERPMLGLPWALQATIQVLPHPDLTEELIENLFVDGGMRLGIGTYRKAFGKFTFSWAAV